MLFFLYGEDIWRKEQKIKAIAEEFARKRDPSRLNIKTLSVAGLEEEDLQQTLRAAPFLAAKRMLILKNVVTGGRKSLIEIVEQALPSLLTDEVKWLIISEDKSKPKKEQDWKNQVSKKVWEYLEKSAKCEVFPELWGVKLEAEITKQAKTYGLTLEKEAAALLAVLSGGDLGWIVHEMEKLAAYKDSHNMNVCTSEDIKLLCTAEGEANIFEFLDALGNKDRKTLLRVTEEEMRESDALHLVARASGHLRAILTMHLAGSQAGAQALKLHPFQAKKISATLRKWNTGELKSLLFQLMVLEYAVKTGRAPDAQIQLVSLLLQNIKPLSPSAF
ncbi:DNA polymerase III subunit delta [Candidatus Uhrbacteria bacterium]|nr:DNA polymerase III subunit delta [Candidatus Uhrbacteria bacterium]